MESFKNGTDCNIKHFNQKGRVGRIQGLEPFLSWMVESWQIASPSARNPFNKYSSVCDPSGVVAMTREITWNAIASAIAVAAKLVSCAS